MSATKQAKQVVVEGLNAEGHSVESSIRESSCEGEGLIYDDILRIHLHRHLCPLRHGVVFTDTPENASQLRRRQQRRSATTYIYRTRAHTAIGFSRKFMAPLADFTTQGTDVRLLLRLTGGGVEVAIDAARLAKWDVNVKTGHISGAKVTISEQRAAKKVKKIIKRHVPTEKKDSKCTPSQLFFLTCGRFRPEKATKCRKMGPRKQKREYLNPPN